MLKVTCFFTERHYQDAQRKVVDEASQHYLEFCDDQQGLFVAVRVCLPRQGFELVMYGDSIMETLRGTDHGLPCGRAGCPEGPGILRAHFGDQWRTAVVATGGGAPSFLDVRMGMTFVGTACTLLTQNRVHSWSTAAAVGRGACL